MKADPQRRGDGTDELATGLVVVGLLSALAGAVDALGLMALKDLFVSFMSGNTTSLGVAVGHGDTARVLLIGSIIVVFVAGAAAGAMLAVALGRYHLPGIVAFAAVVLALPVAVPRTSYYAMTFAMGALNAAMDQAGAVAVSITYITGTLVKLGRGLGLLLCGRRRDFAWLEQAVPWLGIFGGAALATLGEARFGPAASAALPIVALMLAVAFLLLVPRRRPMN